MENLSFENKELYLLGDYNIELLKTDDAYNIDEYYNIISSNFLVPHNPTNYNNIHFTLTPSLESH